jgi:hypothetical protein
VLDDAPKEYLTRGAPFKADVTVVDVGDGPMVVKDFAGRAWWRRLIGRIEVDRECRAYAYVGPMPWFPAFIGRIDSDALAVEKVEGITLRLAEDIDERREDYLGQLRTAMERLAEIGFLHLDARAYRNVLRRPDGRVVFIDLAGSFWIPPGRFGHRLLRRGRPCSPPAATRERARPSLPATSTAWSISGGRGVDSAPNHPPSDQIPVTSNQ